MTFQKDNASDTLTTMFYDQFLWHENIIVQNNFEEWQWRTVFIQVLMMCFRTEYINNMVLIGVLLKSKARYLC